MIQGPPVIQAQEVAKKSKEKGIMINEGAPQVATTVLFDNAPQSKKNGKKKVREQTEAPSATRQRPNPGGTAAMIPVSVSKVISEKLVIHQHPLFGEMILFKKDAPLPRQGIASLLNNPLYALKLARSVISVPDRQFMLKRNMANVFSDLIDLSMKIIIVLCLSFLMFG